LSGEGKAYSLLGALQFSIGDFRKAVEYFDSYLRIAKEVGDRSGEGSVYGNLGCAYSSIGDFKTAIEYHQRSLKIAKEVGDRSEEGKAYCNLGIAYRSLADFKRAIEYHERCLKIAKEVGDRSVEGIAYGNLANAYHSLGDVKRAIGYYERSLKIEKEVGDRSGEGKVTGSPGSVYGCVVAFETAVDYNERHLKVAKQVGNRPGERETYCNLGNAYHSLGDAKRAKEYYERCLKIAKEVGDTSLEGKVYGNLGCVYGSLGDLKTAVEYYERELKIAKEVGDRSGEGNAYFNLGGALIRLGDIKTAIAYQEAGLRIAKEVGHGVLVAQSLYNLGCSFESLGCVSEALHLQKRSVAAFNGIRDRLQVKDEWKISLRDIHKSAYAKLWGLLLKEGKVIEALFSAEQGRAQALRDLMVLKYATETTSSGPATPNATLDDVLSCLPSNTLFIATKEQEVILWVCRKGKGVELRSKKIDDSSFQGDLAAFFHSLMHISCQEIDARTDVKCEDRSLNTERDEKSPHDKRQQQSLTLEKSALSTLFDIIIGPIQDLFLGDELVIVPEGTLCLAPFAVFMDSYSKYLCESFRIRMVPSLTSLKLITDCPTDFHCNTGALLVGDPWVQEVTKLQQLPCAREEVQMIGRIVPTAPLIGRQATKDEVLNRLASVALVHIAAHGRMETGEIALAPNPTAASRAPVEEDFILTIRDVNNVHLRAKLVVLSCCHSARGEIKAEGVVGIARAFLGAGARSVLVSLWEIDDEATLEFMKSFYQHLVKGKSASESLNQAMKCMRESDQFSAVKYWAPFVLIGDDVTLEFDGCE